jgi:monolysocardiolipin acyltransferase
MVYQSKENTMRYFKWGVARLILEPPECPDIVPMFIEGTDQIMPADREFPRFLPRVGNKVIVTFGKKVDTEKVFGDLRTKWSNLKAKVGVGKRPLGELSDELMLGSEAVELRKECTRRVRAEMIKVRRSRGYSDEDPKEGLVETWRREGPKKEGKMRDDTWVEQA